nr:immunoglobulin light chain junction region [Macaca mulatta]
CQQYKSYPLNF